MLLTSCLAVIFSMILLMPNISNAGSDFETLVTYDMVDGEKIDIGNVDRNAKSFRMRNKFCLSHDINNSRLPYLNEKGEPETDNAIATTHFRSFCQDGNNRMTKLDVRILFTPRANGKGFFNEAGHVIWAACGYEYAKQYDCTTGKWHLAGKLPGF